MDAAVSARFLRVVGQNRKPREARRLVELRDRWLNPLDWVDEQIALKSLPKWEVSVHGTPDLGKDWPAGTWPTARW